MINKRKSVAGYINIIKEDGNKRARKNLDESSFEL